MPAIEAQDTTLTKIGAATDVKFGTPYIDDFIVVESVQATNSYQSTGGFKNEVGITVGQFFTDPKIEVTITGIAEKQVAALGKNDFKLVNFVSAVEGSSNSGTTGSEGNETELLVTSVKQDSSNEDFMRFEITAERMPEVDVGEVNYVKKAEFEN